MSSLMKKGLLFCLVAAFVLSGAVVFAGEVATKSDKVSVSLYGQLNRAIVSVNDGNESYLTHVDNDNSSTRFGFKANAKGSDNLTIGGNFEWEYQQNASNNMDQTTGNVNGSLAKRKLEVFLDFAGIGKFTLGHGPTASDGTSQVDLSGTKVAGYSLITAWAGSYQFVSSSALSGIEVGDVMNELDGNSRKDRFQYDSPKFSGFQIAASTFEVNTLDNNADLTLQNTHDTAYDIALKYSGKIGDSVKLAGAIAYSDYPSTDTANAADKMVNGSVSALFSGISVTFAAGQRDLANVNTAVDPDSEKFYFGKLGYMADFWAVGTTAFAIDYGTFDDYNNTTDNEAETYAIYAVQKLKNWGTELYAGYRIHKLEAPGASYEDIGALFLGTRIKF